MKCRCSKCHGCLKTAPLPPRIFPKSILGDSLIIHSSLAKYCELMPLERFAAMLRRHGHANAKPGGLVQGSIRLSEFLEPIYESMKEEVLSSKVISADETPHRMLEGDEKSKWFLWAFLSKNSCFFEIQDTRSGAVASTLLIESQCEILLSDVFSGYDKCTKDVNASRKLNNKIMLLQAYCNAHAFRYFRDAETIDEEDNPKEGPPLELELKDFLHNYGKIYEIERYLKNKSNEDILEARKRMRPHFEAMQKEALLIIENYPAKSKIRQALGYFLNNYEGLTLFLDLPEVPIDNNHTERLIRNPVIGRKTWLGTHSKRGAKAQAILFTIAQGCKLVHVNPYLYVQDQVNAIHRGKPPITPSEYKKLEVTSPPVEVSA